MHKALEEKDVLKRMTDLATKICIPEKILKPEWQLTSWMKSYPLTLQDVIFWNKHVFAYILLYHKQIAKLDECDTTCSERKSADLTRAALRKLTNIRVNTIQIPFIQPFTTKRKKTANAYTSAIKTPKKKIQLIN